MPRPDLKTRGIVLRRTNIGEADRLVDFITPEGQISVRARAVRREKSRLAGGIEMFCVSDVSIYRNPKTRNNTLTYAKMRTFYRGIIADISKLEFASEALRKVAAATRQVDSPEYFPLVEAIFKQLDLDTNIDIIAAWFYFQLVKIHGDQINLLTDIHGKKLDATTTYTWDSVENAMRPYPPGHIHQEEIKLLRLFASAPLELVVKVKDIDKYMPEILYVAKSLNQLSTPPSRQNPF